MGVVIEVKAIKAKKMKIAAVRDQLLIALDYEGEDIRAEYKKTTASWDHQVDFEILTDITGGNATVLVGTDDPIYQYVDEGTKAHMIRPKRRGGMLRFQRGYRAKSKPGHIGSFAGGKHGEFVVARAVRHPGTKARRFSETIQKRRKPKFTKRMIEAARLGADKLY